MSHQAFVDFTEYCRKNIRGDEKGEAQLFLEHFFVALGHAGIREAGASFEYRIKNPDKHSTSFADLVWPNRVLFEMKKRGQDLRLHLQQAATYWQMLAADRPQYIILCNFDEFWIYDFNQSVWEPVEKVEIDKLPEKAEVFSFLFPIPKKPVFGKNLEDITGIVAGLVSEVYRSMLHRDVAKQDALKYCLQIVLSLFAEDTGLLPENILTRILEDLLAGEGDSMETIEISYDLIGGLFREMNTRGITPGGRYKGVEYFDGGLFDEIFPIELKKFEVKLLSAAASKNWRRMNPAIFGSIFESAMESGERHKLGAHYTHELDIKKIVDPVIVQPWNERIDQAGTLDELFSLLMELSRFKVLDPACGSGNFLFVAFREMKLIEQRLLAMTREKARTREEAKQLVQFLQEYKYVTTKQFFGIDLNPFSVELAKVTLMIAKELTYVENRQEDFDNKQQALPLDNLNDNILCADALLDDEGNIRDWPAVDAIIGNPPYQSKNKMQHEFGVEYVNKLRKAYPEIPGRADFCVYWYYQSHRQLKPGCRAGLVGTNTIRQNYSREGSLDYIVKNGGTIFNAVSSEQWSGEAAVYVSIANWIKGRYEGDKLLYQYNSKNELEALHQAVINSSLSAEADVSGAKVLQCNRAPKRVFQGQTHGHEGFLLPNSQALRLLKEHPEYSEVLKPFLIGDELVANPGSQPERFVIDFTHMDMIQASKYQKLFKILEEKVLPDVKKKAEYETSGITKPNGRIAQLNTWWKMWRRREDMLQNISGLERYISCARVTKRPLFEFIGNVINPNDALMIFAFDDYYSFGIINSQLHWAWFTHKCSTLESRFRYTTDTVWDTFAWPQNPTLAQIEKVAAAARLLHETRSRVLREHRLSLRDLYRLLEKPGKNEIRELQQALDAAVMEAYGFDPASDSLQQLLELNLRVAASETEGLPVQAPGLPGWVEEKDKYIGEECVRFEG